MLWTYRGRGCGFLCDSIKRPYGPGHSFLSKRKYYLRFHIIIILEFHTMSR